MKDLKKFIKTTIREYLNESNETNSTVSDLVYSYSPELNNIGNKEQYMKYIDTIYPNSEYNKPVFHATKSENNRNNILINGFDFSKIQNKFRGNGLSISTTIGFTKGFGEYPIAMKINISTWKSGLKISMNNLNDLDYDLITDYSYGLIQAGVITNNNLIHILGSKKDVILFRNYINALQ